MRIPNTQVVEERCQTLLITDRDRHRQCRRPGEREWILDSVPRTLTKNPLIPLGMVSRLGSSLFFRFLPGLYRFPKEHDISLVFDHLLICSIRSYLDTKHPQLQVRERRCLDLAKFGDQHTPSENTRYGCEEQQPRHAPRNPSPDSPYHTYLHVVDEELSDIPCLAFHHCIRRRKTGG